MGRVTLPAGTDYRAYGAIYTGANAHMEDVVSFFRELSCRARVTVDSDSEKSDGPPVEPLGRRHSGEI